MPPILARFPPYTFMQVTSTSNLNVSPPAFWMYSKWPLTLPSTYLTALKARGWLTTSTPKTFGSRIVQLMPPLADSATALSDGDAVATGIASRAAVPASAKTVRRRICILLRWERGQAQSSLEPRSCLERPLPVLERAGLRLFAIQRRRRADLPPEDAREVALVGEAGARGDLG